MSKEKHQSATPATDWLKQHKVVFEPFSYEYVEHGGTASVAAAFGLDHHTVVKTLIMEDEHAKLPLVILMHGIRSQHQKSGSPSGGQNISRLCKPSKAQRNRVIKVGGTSPFGTLKAYACIRKRRFWNCLKFTSTAVGAVLL